MLLINLILLVLTSGFLILLFVSSLLEHEGRASIISFLGISVNSSFWIFFILFNRSNTVFLINVMAVIFFIGFVFISLLKFFPERENRDLSKIQRFDERDHMFARDNLKFYPDLASKYYSLHPEKKEVDQKIHSKPEFGESGHVFFDSLYSPIYIAASRYINRSRKLAKGEVDPEKKKVETEKISQAIKKISRFFGAVDVGITPLKPFHLYSHAGRQADNFGEVIKNTHKNAIIIVVAMDIRMIKTAPALSILLESVHQYVEVSKIADIVAEYIRDFGYDARAHTDGNYETICVPLAVDSGLGELGRLGVFIHPIFGPCVRLAVITTDLELTPTENTVFTIEQFCEICKKCADNCPTQSITQDKQNVSRGFKHWLINQEKCYSYWKTIGSDCGFCIKVCPYTKPNTMVHQLVRFYISRNSLNQRIALFFDDLLYGRKINVGKKNPAEIILD